MALIKCPECGKDISDKASCCVHCGCPITETDTTGTTDESNGGFYYVSRKNDEISLQCKQCHRQFIRYRGSFSSIVGTACVITSTSIKCPNCNNNVSAGTRIESKDSNDSYEITSTTSTNTAKTTSPNTPPKKGIGCGTQLLIFIVLLVLVGMLFGENSYESTGRSAFEKFGNGEFSSMTQAERSYMNDFFKWQHEQQTK